jgi:hypothetical protein
VTTYCRLWLRGFVQVSLVACQTTQIAHGKYDGAFVVGWLISFVWWWNSSARREDVTGAGAVYALGAACGTVIGMWVGAKVG